ncbi:hypothetical protein DAEQUDRAFT_702864 [Daedalea quercina L-15889]|uniref:tRNA-splicing endonuclease subunit Sen15 domain-containing protein n=1 Tax=Daedalea quercina L-15889 TaxID=1314783 RepID=A0A165TS50_9APHY|nr:hypothetical protein DAEQUDRAFT_702864 [Daedalea quercina L-15889]
MDQHPSYSELAAFLPNYPRAAGALFQTFNDLKLAQQWTDLEVVDLASCSRGALRGRRPRTEEVLCVIPCSLSESLSLAWLQDAFHELESPSQIYLAINTEDSSIVYYKISPGIVKPPV